jgi:GPH family glycoside/pentoside/hexuronide:cation symporter
MRALPELSRTTLLVFGLPVVGAGFLNTLSLLYLFKYATDVLLIAPAAMGVVFMLGRFWDAASDPLVGYLSDRTTSRLGRRRSWLLASAPLFLACPLMVWLPPEFLTGWMLLAWVATGMLALDTAFTAFFVPHGALGAELTLDHHERTRVFAYRQAGTQIGAFLALAGMYGLASAEDKRVAATWIVGAGGVLSAALIAGAGLRLRERVQFRDRGAARPLGAASDVLRNPHARLVLIVLLIEHLGQACLMVLAPYHVQYVLGDESLLPFLAGAYMVASLLVVPAGLAASQRLGKKRVWLACMALTGLAYGAMFFADRGDALYVCVLAALIGIGNGVGLTVGASVQADIVDYDEYLTGERKEGVYFAAWNIVRKAASGLTGFLAGLALQEVGFRPNAEQAEATKWAIRGLMSLVPLAAFAIGLALFTRFRLDEPEHRRIRAEIEARESSTPRRALR